MRQTSQGKKCEAENLRSKAIGEINFQGLKPKAKSMRLKAQGEKPEDEKSKVKSLR